MDEDRQLAVRAATGDVAAFTALVRRHEAAIRRFLARLTRGDGGDDLAQECFSGPGSARQAGAARAAIAAG